MNQSLVNIWVRLITYKCHHVIKPSRGINTTPWKVIRIQPISMLPISVYFFYDNNAKGRGDPHAPYAKMTCWRARTKIIYSKPKDDYL